MRPVRYAGAFVALVFLAGSVVLTAAKVLTPDRRWWILAVSFAPYALVGFAVAVVLLLLVVRGTSGRQRLVVMVGLGAGLVGLVAQVVWLVPAYVGPDDPSGADLTVVAFNLRFGGADPAATQRLLEGTGPAVIVLSEATPEAVDELARRGIGGPDSQWPHQGGQPLPGFRGTVVLSAYPLSSQTRLPVSNGAHRMRVGSPEPFWLTAVHTSHPLVSAVAWRRDFEVLVADAERVDGPHVSVGDFNATLDHGRMRDLLDTGLRDAAREAGSGWQPTWPVPGTRRLAGLRAPYEVMALDHVLVSEEFAALDTTTHRIPGSDHRALVAHLRQP